jgi:hypothetical protein
MTNLVNPFIKFPSADFLPSDISSLSNWYDANDEDSITKDGSNRVSQWDDKKGSDDLLQATGGNQPLFVNVGQNGLHEISFAGDRTMETSSGSTKTQPITIYLATKLPVNDTNTRRIIQGEDTAGLIFLGNNSPVYIIDIGGTAFNGAVGSTPDTWALLKLFLDGADTSFFAIDEVTITTGSLGTNDLTGLDINDEAGSNYANGIMGEICIFDGALSAEDNASMITYLSDKWNINQ